jgi:hypothetical protein
MSLQNPVVVAGQYIDLSGVPHAVDVSVDVNGFVNVNATFSGSISGNAAAGLTGAAVPTSADYLGVTIAGTLTGVTGVSLTNAKAVTVAIVDGSGNQITSFGGGTQYATGTAVATPTGTAALGWEGTNVRILSTNASGQLNVIFPSAQPVTLTSTTITGTVAVTGTFFQATQPVSGTVAVSNFPATQPVSGTVTVGNASIPVTQSGTWTDTVTQATAANLNATVVFPSAQAVTLASTTITGSVSVTQGTSPWIVAGGGTAGSSGTAVLTIQGISGGTVVPVSLTSTTVTGTVAVTQSTSPWVVSLASTTVTGTVAVTQSTSPWVVSLTSTTITGTVAVTQSTSPWVVNQTQVAGTTLGATAVVNYGSTPAAAAVPGVNAFVTNSVTVAQATAASLNATVVPGGSAIFEVSPTTAANTNANPFFNSLTDGTTKVTVISATAALKTDLSSVAGTATVTAAAGVQKVGIVGNTNATLDAAINGAAPTNALWHTAAPATASAAALLTKIISATGALTLIKGLAGNLYGMYFLNTGAAAGWVQFFNAATTGAVTLGTTAPVWAAPITSGGTIFIPPGASALLNFSAGIVYACTTLLQGSVTDANSGTVEYI